MDLQALVLRQKFATKKIHPQNWRLWSFENFGDAQEKDVCCDAPPLVAVGKEAGIIFLKVNLWIMSQILWLAEKEHRGWLCWFYWHLFDFHHWNSIKLDYIRLNGRATTPPAIWQAVTENHHLQVRFISSTATLSKFLALNFRVHVVFQHGWLKQQLPSKYQTRKIAELMNSGSFV